MMAKESGVGSARLPIIGLVLLAVLTLVVVGLAFVRTPEPAAPTIDLARAEAAQDKFQADQEAKAAAIKAANAPLKLAHPEGRPLNVLFAGDSISVGRDASSEAATYRAQVMDALGERGETTTVRLGDSGKTTAEVQPEAAARTAASDLLIVELGTNDLYKNAAEQFTLDYPAMLDSVRKSSPDAPLICVGVWQSSPAAASLDAIIENECATRGGRFVSMRLIHQNPANRSMPGTPHFAGGLTDGAHPNDDGHKLLASGVLERLDRS